MQPSTYMIVLGAPLIEPRQLDLGYSDELTMLVMARGQVGIC